MLPKKLLVFDLETIPDVALCRTLWEDAAADLDDAAVVEKLYEKMLEETGGKSNFPKLPYHKIVAIGCLLADIETADGLESYHFRRLGCIGEGTESEKELVTKFFEFGAAHAMRLISFNGRMFDVPCLKMRALTHGLDASWLINGPATGRGDKWSHYGSRYDGQWHVDLRDVLTDFGASPGGGKLDEIATLIGLPGKLDMAGDHVWQRVAAGDLEGVRTYCETDVLNTYLLYLKWQRTAGTLAPEGYAKATQDIKDHLTTLITQDKSESQSAAKTWQAFLGNWTSD